MDLKDQKMRVSKTTLELTTAVPVAIREHVSNEQTDFQKSEGLSRYVLQSHVELARLIVMNKLKTKANCLASLA